MLLIQAQLLMAQEMKLQSFELKPLDMSAKINPVLDLNDEPCALIRVAIASENVTFQGSIINDPIYNNGEWSVYMPAATQKIKIYQDGYLPITVEFTQDIEKLRTYEIRIESPTVAKNGMRTILLPTYSLSSSQNTYGAMIGFVKKNGAFIRYKSNFDSVKSSFDIDDSGKDEDDVTRWMTGESKSYRWSITGGYIKQFSDHIYMYGGAGYGERVLAYQNISGEYGRVESASYRGVELEAGCIARLGFIAISAGLQTNSFKNCELNIGVGVMF